MLDPEAPVVVITVGEPDKVEMLVKGPLAEPESWSASADEFTKFELTYAETLQAVEMKLENDGLIR